MALAEQAGNGSAIERVLELIRASGRGGEERANFARLLLADVDEGELEAYAPEGLAALAISAWEFCSTRKPHHHRIRAFNPSGLATTHGEVTVIEILNDDMPFLVDSVIGEILERGLTVHFVVHPIFIAQRDAQGRLQSVSAPGQADTGDGVRESYIQIHIWRLANEEQLEELKRSLSSILSDVRLAVRDWQTMMERLRRATAAYTNSPPPVAPSELAESIAFLKWLADDNFTFLGMRAMAYVGGTKEGRLEPIPDSGLGILRDPNLLILRRGREAVHMTQEIRKFFLSPEPLIITKANMRSTVHRRSHMDYIGVKIYSASGEISGELRIVGLFTSAAYTRSVKKIPFLRHKVQTVMDRSGFSPDSHSGKALLNVLETFPRDELFQIGTDQLRETALGVMALDLKPRTRVFARVDEFDRFVSVLVYVPRDRFSTEVRQRIGEFLAETYKGRVSAFYPFFPEGPLVRIHFIIGRYDEGKTPTPHMADLEAQVARIARTWNDNLGDALRQHFDKAAARRLNQRYLTAFPPGYEANTSVERAIADIKRLERVSSEHPIAVDFYRDPSDGPERLRVALYHADAPIPLSHRVPILENLGFAVIDERSYDIEPRFGEEERTLNLHDMILETRDRRPVDLLGQGEQLEDCFLAVWDNRTGNDPYNRLVLNANFDWREAAALRAYGSFLRQIRAPFGQAYLADTLVKHEDIARDLLALFHLRFDPSTGKTAEERLEAQQEIVDRIETELESVPSLDEDRIIRHFRNLICTTTRTNFYQRDKDGQPHGEIAFKFASAELDSAPEPRPFAEIFVFSPRVEGLHLRAGPIARGGLRWSDRLQDFRTEVLGLAKAQLVKNTVIVPTGAKGGFVPKLLPVGGSRDEIQTEAIAAYKLFVSTLLALTDNLVQGEVVPPQDVVRFDGDDPYLVVAADKGTATFSDIANEISLAHNCWLGDAFASGGSAGYDHKKMGITARGAWEAVRRHFREMDVDIQTTPFTVIGVGDMSGDVFGNGMLLSKQIKLAAAFDHRDIFIDPNPDPATSWAERKRLFELPRSSWRDYDAGLISAGGGVFSRASKSIALTPEIRTLLGITKTSLTPNELIRAVLGAEADLLWFGGIGTYVKASDETDAEVGDRSNDPVRVHASQLRIKVVGEGANLGVTQRGRIEFAMDGGHVNTDAIDNSAGVNTSDQEVNIKIALGEAINAGKLDLAGRNSLLSEMTEDVARAVLRNNYLQTLALSLGKKRGLSDLGFQERLMTHLQRIGILDTELAFLPSATDLAERRKLGIGLTRPELAVLLAYSKIDLTNDLIASRTPDDAYFSAILTDYFPDTMRERFPQAIADHRLRREIIATELANKVINRGGSTMVVRLKEETGRDAAEIALAFAFAEAVFDLDALYARIDALDNKISGQLQLGLYLQVQTVTRRQTAWFLRHLEGTENLSVEIELYRSGLRRMRQHTKSILTDKQRTQMATDRAAYEQQGLPTELATQMATLGFLADVPDAIHVAQTTHRPVEEIAAAFAQALSYFRIGELRRATDALEVNDYFDRLAINSLQAVLSAGLRAVVQDVVRVCSDGPPNFEHWRQVKGESTARAKRGIDEILDEGALTISRLTVAVTHLRDLVPA